MVEHQAAVEAYLLRIAPDLAEQWQGATDAEIAAIQRLTPHPLPDFYRWFLRKMGRRSGATAYPTFEFSVARILQAYSEDELDMDDRHLLIGYNEDEMMPLHVFYDLERSNRGDALVLESYAAGGERYLGFESFAEMLVSGASLRHRVQNHARRCHGSFSDPECKAFERIDGVMTRLGFEQPVVMGDRCRLYERDEATMICFGNVSAPQETLRVFRMGAADVATLRSVLGRIATETGVVVEVSGSPIARLSDVRRLREGSQPATARERSAGACSSPL